MDTSKELTEFDGLIRDHHLQMMKAAIPYMPAYGQQILSIYAKSLELSNTLKLLNREGSRSVGICSISENKRNTTKCHQKILYRQREGTSGSLYEFFQRLSHVPHLP